MKLRSRILLITLLFMVIVILALFPITSLLMLRTFEDLEEKQALEDMRLIKSEVEKLFQDMATRCGEVSVNDDTVEFIKDPGSNTGFGSKEMGLPRFKSLEAEIIIIMDMNGEILFSRSFDLLTDVEDIVPQDLIDVIGSDTSLWRFSTPRDDRKGFLQAGEMIMEFASRPAVRSSGVSDVLGTVMMFRRFDQDTLNHLPTSVALEYQKLRVQEGEYIPSDYQSIIDDGPVPVTVRTHGGDEIRGYACIHDYRGEHLFILKATMSRDISEKGRNSIIYYSLMTAMVFLIGIAFFGAIVEVTVIRRLTHLSADVENISPDRVINERTQVKGKDEIGNLSNSINSMLGSMERKQAELLLSEEKYRKLVRASPTGIAILREEKILFLNETGGTILGLMDPALVLGRSVKDFLPEARHGLVVEVGRYLEKGGFYPLQEVEVIRPDGKRLHVQMMATKVAYQGSDAVMINFMDITELHKARKEMMDRELRYRTLYELSTDSIMLMTDGIVISCNPATSVVTGQPISEIIGKGIDDLSPRDQTDGSRSREHMDMIQKRLKGGNTLFVEWNILRPDRKVVNTEISFRSFVIEGQEFAFAIMRDITERKNQESRVLEERNRAEFYLDLLTHDVGNLHQGIYSNLELMEMVHHEDIEISRKYLEQTMALTSKSMHLIRYVRILSQPLEQERERVDLDKVVESSLMKVRASFPRKMMMISVKGVAGKCVLSHNVIEEAVFNLLHNAVKVQNRGDPVVEIEAMDEGPYVSLYISDHGPGLSEERKTHLFDRDRNGHKIRFTGIGLTIVKRLMDAFGDGIEVLDRVPDDPSQGLRFKIVFKRYQEDGK